MKYILKSYRKRFLYKTLLVLNSTNQMKKPFFTILLLVSMLSGCQTDKKEDKNPKYLRWVGDIVQNEQTDASGFRICNGEENVLQYFNLGEGPVYHGEKKSIVRRFKSQFTPIPDDKEDGLIRIRFLVNCEGMAGRFRVLQSDYQYQEKEFDSEIVSQLLSTTTSIEQWEVLYRNNIPVDYYMYLIFKISDGQLTEILP
ncbi:hypothetical protein [Luteirhabdus pelagi]|uniref:hypothetical protein n=1 Tax=Luteirhabdus pelagi TaxID=2792783 RepID=UPI001F40CB52|nr:hypothetical protein [Luteirhabdus pelagi]